MGPSAPTESIATSPREACLRRARGSSKVHGLSARIRIGALLLGLLSCGPKPAAPPADPGAPDPTPKADETPENDPLESDATSREQSGFLPPFDAVVQGNEPEPVRFGWSTPCKVPIRQHVIRRDPGEPSLIVTSHMFLRLDAHDDGLRGLLTDYTFDSVGGIAADDPEIADEIATLTATARSAMPFFIVDAAGRYQGLGDVEETIEAVLRLVEPDMRPKVEAVLRRKDTLQQMEDKAADYWKGWVELWTERPLTPGETFARPTELAIYDTRLRTELVMTHRGTVVDAPNLRLLEARQTLDGPEVTNAMLERLRVLAESTGAPTPPDDAVKSVRRHTLMQVIIDPDGAFPHRMRTETTTEIDDLRRSEATDWELDWSAAEGCQRSAP